MSSEVDEEAVVVELKEDVDDEPAPELSVLPELEAPIEELDPEAELCREEADREVAAIGADTLFARVEVGMGKAMVTDWR